MHSSRMRTVRCSGRRGVSHRGLSAQGIVCPGGCLPQCMLGYTSMNRMTNACENITLPQLLCGR